MFGTITRMRPQAGRQADVIRLFEEWGRERGPRVPGAMAGYLMRPLNRPDELIAVPIFADRATYEANANDPQQDAWYRSLRELLEEDPIWEDGEYVVSGAAGDQPAETNKAIASRKRGTGTTWLRWTISSHRTSSLTTPCRACGPDWLARRWRTRLRWRRSPTAARPSRN